MSDDGHGPVLDGSFSLPSLHGSILRKHLMALAAPRVATPTLPRAQTPTRHTLGLAFLEKYVQSRPADSVPDSGGVRATVVVTMPLESLLGGLARGPGSCDGSRISAAEAQRLARRAGIIPVVLGGARSRSTWVGSAGSTPWAMRVALGLRDQGCTAEGCDRPAPRCATPPTTSPGAGVGHRPASRPAGCGARATTPSPTTSATR